MGQTTASDGLCQTRDDSVLMERLAAGCDTFPVQLRFADLPVSASFVEKVAEMEQTKRSLLLSKSQHGRKIHVAKWTPTASIKREQPLRTLGNANRSSVRRYG